MKLLRSCKLNILQWRINPKYAFVAMYMVLYMWYETQGFVAYSRALGYPVRPWLFPLLPCDPGNFVRCALPQPAAAVCFAAGGQGSLDRGAADVHSFYQRGFYSCPLAPVLDFPPAEPGMGE